MFSEMRRDAVVCSVETLLYRTNSEILTMLKQYNSINIYCHHSGRLLSNQQFIPLAFPDAVEHIKLK
jgi:hypothetical protein